MQIYINDEKINFTLENEKTLLDVIRSTEAWLHDQKMVIVTVEIDGKKSSYQDLTDQATAPIKQFQELRITASDFLKIEMEGITTAKDFYLELSEAVKTADAKKLPDLLARFPAMQRTLAFLLASERSAESEQKSLALERLFAGTTRGMIVLWDEQTKTQAVGLCEYIILQLEKKEAAFADLEQSSVQVTKDILSKLRDIVERLSDVSILLQTGKDSEAMQAIAAFSEMAQLFLRLIVDVLFPQQEKTLSIDGESFESYSSNLNVHLRELIEAFEKKDYILIGDLCEYEIAPKILRLIDQVEKALPA